MGLSVLITTPFPTPEEIAAGRGMSPSRLQALRDIVEQGAKRNGIKTSNASKAAAPGASVRKKNGRVREKR